MNEKSKQSNALVHVPDLPLPLRQKLVQLARYTREELPAGARPQRNLILRQAGIDPKNADEVAEFDGGNEPRRHATLSQEIELGMPGLPATADCSVCVTHDVRDDPVRKTTHEISAGKVPLTI